MMASKRSRGPGFLAFGQYFGETQSWKLLSALNGSGRIPFRYGVHLVILLLVKLFVSTTALLHTRLLRARGTIMASWKTNAVRTIATTNGGDFAKMRDEFEEHETRAQTLNPHLRAMRNMLGYALHELHDGTPQVSGPLIGEVLKRVDKALEIVGNSLVLREGWVSEILDQLVRTQAFEHFVTHGNLIRQSDPRLQGRVNDDEYLGGVMGLSNELARHAIKRASELDVDAVVRCRDLLTTFNGKLLEFDFRNGNLRRKFDAVKWGVRRTEDLLYELSVVGVTPSPQSAMDDGEKPAVVDVDELEAIRQRMMQYDERREHVIKTSRDVQKNSKQAIYAVHRGDHSKAAKLLDLSRKVIEQLESDIKAYPTLRFGAYSSSLEEYGEAEVFKTWKSEGRLVSKDELKSLSSAEYLGALVDFTGEMGRHAVHRATERDVDAVRTCLETDAYVSGELVQMSLPKSLQKKTDELRTNYRKLETLSYELALVKAGKGTVAGVETDEPPPMETSNT